MPMIFAIGETVLDIIFENEIPVSACVGGSMFNSAISLGRMHAPVSMITGYSNDQPGKMADDFLKKNGVDDSLVMHYDDGKTTIALAFLDEAKKASYQFYQEWPSNRVQWSLPEFTHGDLLLFGSVFSLRPFIRPYFSQLFEKARQAGICSIYDPNFRAAHLNDLEALKPAILANMSNASIIRGSDEDFEHIFGLTDPDVIYSVIKAWCQNLIITQGPDEVLLYTSKLMKRYSIPNISVISTIGAGDSFNAGLLKSLLLRGTNLHTLETFNEQAWDDLIHCGVACASAVCCSKENYVPAGF
ncbi:MAG: PfkB family carbohydrate kinase [Bacteroidota bacterium]